MRKKPNQQKSFVNLNPIHTHTHTQTNQNFTIGTKQMTKHTKTVNGVFFHCIIIIINCERNQETNLLYLK